MIIPYSHLLLGLTASVAAARANPLYDAYTQLQFRNPETNNVARSTDGQSLVPQCVLYSEIDNVSSLNKGCDVGAGVGWTLDYPYTGNGSVPPTGIRSAVPLGGMGTGNFELRVSAPTG